MSDPLPHGIIRTPEEFRRSQADTSIHYLTRGDSIGLTIVVQAGLVSLIAILYVVIIILRNVIWRIRQLRRERLRIFHQPMDLLMQFSLFLADALQAIGGVLDLKWISDGKVEVGAFCDAQGIIQNVGETAVAMTTLLIAIFTFIGVWTGTNVSSMHLTRAVLAGVWLFIGLVVVIGNTVNHDPSKPFQSPTPYWCWVSQNYMTWRILGEYLWFWITLGFSFLVYIPLYLWIRGNIVIHDPQWWKFHFQHSNKLDPTLPARRRQSLVMAAYPFVYCLNILPLSVVRWIGFQREAKYGIDKANIPAAATFAVTSIYGLSGFLNVILLLTTKPESGLFGRLMHISSARPPSPTPSLPAQHPSHQDDSEGVQETKDDEYSLGRLPSR
jgi:hypothetical protein